MAEALNTCLFCQKSFKGLGQHLPCCPDRHNREYKQYLKTFKEKGKCPGCKETFKRFDLHLKSSHPCHLFAVDKSVSISQLRQHQHSGSMENAQFATPPVPIPAKEIPFLSKQRLRLPTHNDLESWKKADEFMNSVVTTSILSLTSVDIMNTTLNDQIYNFFLEHHGATFSRLSQQNQHQHNHRPHLLTAFARIRRKKNELKKQFRKASKYNTCTKDDLAAMGKAFHYIVKEHNKLRREVLKRDRIKAAKYAIKQCSSNFWSFTEKLLSDDTHTNTQPSFEADKVHTFFSKTYTTTSNSTFSKPPWMPNVPTPSAPFHHDPITPAELQRTLNKCRCGSSPSPLDGIPYTILKRCLSLQPALLHHSTPA